MFINFSTNKTFILSMVENKEQIPVFWFSSVVDKFATLFYSCNIAIASALLLATGFLFIFLLEIYLEA